MGENNICYLCGTEWEDEKSMMQCPCSEPELMGFKKGQRIPKNIIANSWVGISKDEAHRMKPNRVAHINNLYPLIDKDMTRGHCLEWMKNKGYPRPPRSACYYCPFHSDKEWLNIKQNDKRSWSKIVRYERKLQEAASIDESLLGDVFLHKSLKPIDEVRFDVNNTEDLFGNECEGMCGV